MTPLRSADIDVWAFGTELDWTCWEGATWVASRSGDFVGMVELRHGRFIANNTVDETYRSYFTLADAQRAFGNAPTRRADARVDARQSVL